MIIRLDIPNRNPMVARTRDVFAALYGGVFWIVSAEPGLDPDHPSVRIACDLRPGAVFLNSPPVRLVATDGTRFEFHVTEADLEALEKWRKRTWSQHGGTAW